jgi:hypothetical protein
MFGLQDMMGPHPAEQALAQKLKQPSAHARNVQEANAQMWANDRDNASQFGMALSSRAPADEHDCFDSMLDIVRLPRLSFSLFVP